MTKVPKVKGCAFSAHYFITAEIQIILDPGSHPAPRDLAAMTNWDIAS